MRRTSHKQKIKEKRGTGSGIEYKSYINAREFNSQGTTSSPIDWKTGRTMQLLSQGEEMLWYIVRFDENVIDIREQFPLDMEKVKEICIEKGIKTPTGVMTTDLLVSYSDGSQIAYSVKISRESIMNSKKKNRLVEKLYIEKCYWDSMPNTHYQLVFKNELNKIYYQNVREVAEFYDIRNVHDQISMIKHLIAIKQIKVDMKNSILNFKELLKIYSK